jgi:hypothetical protein
MLLRRRRWLMAGVLFVVLLTATGALFLRRWHDRGPEAASVSAAVDRFRSSSTSAAPSRDLTPEPGVYTYRGEGEERLSFMSTSQSQGPALPATLTVSADGCWAFEIEYNSFHRQRWDWCADANRLLEHGGTTRQKFDFVAFKMAETTVSVCDPPVVAFDLTATPGAYFPTYCAGHSETTGTDMTSAGTTRFVGREHLTIAGHKIPALHYVTDRTISGEQTGHEHVEMWFSPSNGLPVRNERVIRVASPAPAPLDEVTYEEHGSWQLAEPAVHR